MLTLSVNFFTLVSLSCNNRFNCCTSIYIYSGNYLLKWNWCTIIGGNSLLISGTAVLIGGNSLLISETFNYNIMYNVVYFVLV